MEGRGRSGLRMSDLVGEVRALDDPRAAAEGEVENDSVACCSGIRAALERVESRPRARGRGRPWRCGIGGLSWGSRRLDSLCM